MLTAPVGSAFIWEYLPIKDGPQKKLKEGGGSDVSRLNPSLWVSVQGKFTVKNMKNPRFTPNLKNRQIWAIGALGLFAWACAEAESLDAIGRAKEIDALVLSKLEQQKLPPNARATDEVFLRRVYLDTVGRIPSLKETQAFLADPAADKRVKLIDQLLASPGYQQNYFNFWADVLRLKSTTIGGGQSLPAGLAYADWLKQSLAANKPYDVMVKELITAEGKTYDNGAVGFYIRDYNMQLDNMAVTTQVFLGTQMVCAQCHDHPFDKWSMMDYYQMAAHTYGVTGSNGLVGRSVTDTMYSKKGKKGKNGSAASAAERKEMGKAMTEILRPLRYNTVVRTSRALKLPHDYQYDNAKPFDVVQPVIPAAFAPDGKVTVEGQSPVDAYAQWMTSKENPRFTLVIANRLWKKVMGQGVIEPVDELTDSTVPTNPALMTYLEKLMKELSYDMKGFLRVVMNTESYQRASYTKELTLGEPFYFPGPLMRRMSAEQIWDSMVVLYKPQADRVSLEAELERENLLTRVRWLDNALAALSDEELTAGAKRIAGVQKQLAADVRKAQEDLTKAQEAKDEDGIRAAKRVVAKQRNEIDQAVEDIVYEMGYQKFVQLAKDGKIKEQTDPEMATEITAVLKSKNGDKLGFDEALAAVQKMRRSRLNQIEEAQRDRMRDTFDVSKEDAKEFSRFAYNCEKVMVRAADVRSPAPLGHFLREFGQSDRELIENSNKEATVGQALMMLNGEQFEDILNPFTVLSRALKGAKDADAAVDTLYLSLLSRRATVEEKKLLGSMIQSGDTKGQADALWALINTKQFLFIQ